MSDKTTCARNSPTLPQPEGGRHAYLILAHGQFKLLGYLLSLLDDPRNDIFIHLDAKVTHPPYEQLAKAVHHSRLTYTATRYDIGWASPEMSLAELCLFETAYKSATPYAYYHLISGDTLPVKSQDAIHQYLAAPERAGRNYITIHPTYDQEGYNRLTKYHFRSIVRGPHTRMKVLWKIPHLVIRLQGLLNIDRLRGRFPTYCVGHQWCSLTGHAVRHLLTHREEIGQLLRHTLTSDEVYKQLYLFNDAALRQTLGYDEATGQSCCLTYADWSQGGSHPRSLTADDYPALLATPLLFARKFSEAEWELVDMIGRHVRGLAPSDC